MPPSTPPAWLVRVETVVPSVTKGSLWALPACRRRRSRRQRTPPGRRGCRRGPGQPVLHPLEHGLPHPGGEAHSETPDQAPHGVRVHPGPFDLLAHGHAGVLAEHREGPGQQGGQGLPVHGGEVRRLVLHAADLSDVGRHGDAPLLQELEGQGPGEAQRGRQAAGELPAPSNVVALAVLHPGGVVGVGGPGGAAQALVVPAALVAVADDGAHRGPAGPPLHQPGEDLRGVGFLPGGGPGGPPRGPPGQEGRQAIHVRDKPRRQALHHAADGRGVGLSEHGDPQLMSQGVHG